MSLFTIARYTGDEQSDSPKQKNKEASDILKKIQREAKLRQQGIINNKKHYDGDKTDLTVRQEKADENDESGGVDEIKTGKSPKKKKRKKERAILSEEEQDSPSKVKKENDTEFPSESKPKKKKKHSKSDKTSTIESESPVKINGDCNNTDNDNLMKNKTKTSSLIKDKKEKNVKVDSNVETSRLSSDSDSDSSENDDAADDDEKEGNEIKTETKDELTDAGPGSKQIGGFTVIGTTKQKQLKKVQRVLPDWLSSPTLVSCDLKSDLVPVSEMPGLDPDLVQAVIKNGISSFFPVQSQVIPVLLHSAVTGFHLGRAGYRPNDICVSAPTGSGKTLAFVLPIVQALKSRVTCEVRALAVLPVKDLATQVYKVFEEYCKVTDLKVGCLIGQKPFVSEQKQLVRRKLSGYKCAYDIIVATPGRLVDHINKTQGFNLAHLRYLVIDEADRMMDEIKQDWLTQTEAAVYRARSAPQSLTGANCAHPQIPIQKLLYSATLSQNPEQLQPLNLFQPKLFTSTAKGLVPINHRLNKLADDTQETQDKNTPNKQPVSLSREDLEKYTTPTELSEYVIETTPERKPMVVLHLLHNLGYRNVLCFTNSVDATHRLSCLLKLYGGVEAAELSSGFHVSRRDSIIQKFMAGKIDIIICSDVMARGIDIVNVKYVVSYDPPKFIQTHIHRIGRTARAGKEGVALTILQDKEFFHFKKTMRHAGKKVPPKMAVTKADLKPLQTKYEAALKELPNVLKVKVSKSDESESVTTEDKEVVERDKKTANKRKRPASKKEKTNAQEETDKLLTKPDEDSESIKTTPKIRKRSVSKKEESPAQEVSDNSFTKLKADTNETVNRVNEMDIDSDSESESKPTKKVKKKRKKSMTES